MEAVRLFREIQQCAERVAVLEHVLAEQQKQIVLVGATREAVDFLASVQAALVPECFVKLLVQVEIISKANGGIVTLAVARAAISRMARG